MIAISVFTLTSIGCAFCGNFASLVTFRVLQGFAGGTLIPAVFSGIFLLFPARAHPIAGTIAGIMAVLAPTVGPVVGGWITYHYSWPWLFLVNVVPGVVAVDRDAVPAAAGQGAAQQSQEFRRLSLAMMALALASLEIGLKQAPHIGLVFGVRASRCSRCARSTAALFVDPDPEGGAAGGRTCRR